MKQFLINRNIFKHLNLEKNALKTNRKYRLIKHFSDAPLKSSIYI